MTNRSVDATAASIGSAGIGEAEARSNAAEAHPRPSLSGRAVSLVMLSAVTASLGYAGHTAYFAARDSYVAPAIFSPDNDLVIANKLKLSELAEEKAHALAVVEGLDANVAADEEGIVRLEGLRAKLDRAGRWTSQMTASTATSRAAELNTIARQRSVMSTMLEQQRALTARAAGDLDTGLISRTDYAREAQALNQMELALLENERAKLESEAVVGEAAFAQRALSSADAAPMPELLAQEGEAVRVELEIAHLDSDRRAKSAERTATLWRVGRIDQLSDELRRRPLFRAAEESLDMAFVPYTQLDGVAPGAAVYSCVWGLFNCRQVGTVSELVPGESVAADPWGAAARGQYAVLNLWDRSAARAKTLRIRFGARSTAKGG